MTAVNSYIRLKSHKELRRDGRNTPSEQSVLGFSGFFCRHTQRSQNISLFAVKFPGRILRRCWSPASCFNVHDFSVESSGSDGSGGGVLRNWVKQPADIFSWPLRLHVCHRPRAPKQIWVTTSGPVTHLPGHENFRQDCERPSYGHSPDAPICIQARKGCQGCTLLNMSLSYLEGLFFCFQLYPAPYCGQESNNTEIGLINFLTDRSQRVRVYGILSDVLFPSVGSFSSSCTQTRARVGLRSDISSNSPTTQWSCPSWVMTTLFLAL